MFMMQLDRAKLSAEQNSRLDALIVAQAPLPPDEAGRLRSDVPFLLDCLNSEEPAVRAAALERLRLVCREPIYFDPAIAPAARGPAVAALREKLAR